MRIKNLRTTKILKYDKIKIGKNVKIVESYVDSYVSIGNDVTIKEGCSLRVGVKIRKNTYLGRQSTIGNWSIIGDHVKIYPHSLIRDNSIIKPYSTVYCASYWTSGYITIYYDEYLNKVEIVGAMDEKTLLSRLPPYSKGYKIYKELVEKYGNT